MRHITLISGLLLAAAASASSPMVTADFEARRSQLPRELFEIFDDRVLTPEERDAMQFMYAYMPLPDIAGHSADFHLDNIRAALKARREMPWGATVPEREFMYFVLPNRVNNEALDMSRPVIYDMLAERVKGLSMRDAILEVNHWCHEYVTYKPSDARTSSPLSAMSQAIGRCGEESTFTVAALRAVGIPARQVYTPRWAHTDDNHAWVEAWADGEWYFLGACEPAPVLDMAWFNAPASRGLLMTTNVFGNYDGPEEQIEADRLCTTINVTDKYAPVGTVNVIVTDTDGRPVNGARVAFSIYNHAEFYQTVVKQSDANGHASLNTGMGEMLVWASDNGRFGWAKASPADGTVTVVLDKDASYNGSFDMTITPPHTSAKLPAPSADLVATNDRRMQHEDSIRKAYEATFVTPAQARRIAETLGDGTDTERVIAILGDARGNSHRLAELLQSLEPDRRAAAVALLGAVTEKDRRDIPVEVIYDNIDHGTHRLDDPVYVEYVLSPRIDIEPLTPFKAEFTSRLGKDRLDAFRNNPQSLVEWITGSVAVDRETKMRRISFSPVAVLDIMTADPKSRDIFFVAMARTAGIPSRIDPVTGKVQMIADNTGEWSDVNLDGTDDTIAIGTTPHGNLQLTYTPVGRLVNPRYATQFTISRIYDGVPRLLEYDEDEGLREITARNEPLDAGQYMLVTGQRMADGSVLIHSDIFHVVADSTVTIPFTLREDPNGVQVIGSLNAENLYRPLTESEDRSILSTTGRGYYALGIIKPGHEPSAHALNDMSAAREELEQWGRQIVVLFEDDDAAARFDRDHFRSLPANITFGIDTGGVSQAELIESLNLPSSDLPIFVIADSFNRVVFVTQGYNIGLGDQLLDTISKLTE